MRNICTITFNTHGVTVSQDDNGTYHIFKYTDTRCEMESFEDREEAEEYVLYPFPAIEFSLVINED